MKKTITISLKRHITISTILKNQQSESEVKEAISFLFERILSLILIEFNTYRIKYCSYCSNISYLLLNSIDFKTSEVNVSLKYFMKNFFVERYCKSEFDFSGSNFR